MEKYNLVKVFEKSILSHWDLPALSDYKGSTLTYGMVGEKIIKLHKAFEHCGLKPGDKVALIGKNSANWGIAYLATVTYGATIVPILPDFHPDNVHHIINHSDSKLLFAGENVWPNIVPNNLKQVMSVFSLVNFSILSEKEGLEISNKVHIAEEEFFDKFPNGVKKEQFVLPEVENSNLGVISYTSGTTGNSKGVMLPLDSLMANIHFAWHNMPLEAEDKILSILPLAHAYGCAFEFLWPFTIGVHITFLGKIVSPQVMIQAFQDVKPRLLLMVPLIMEKIYKKQLQPVLSKLSMRVLLVIPVVNQIIYGKIKTKLSAVFGGNFREVVIGGAALNKDVEVFLRRIGFNFSVGYGMTECGPLISYANWDKAQLGSCGKLVDSLELMIDSPDPDHIPGEIMVKGTNVMLGYYKNEKETQKVLDEDGWLHTGDLGITDKSGYIFIRGRSKSMILGPSGENIYPEEIESKLNNFPYVQEQLVINDNNKLVALVFPDKDKIEREQINEEQLAMIMEENKKMLNSQLPKYMQISRIELQNQEFEKTPKQSIKRFKYEKN
ncbi:MAG TPA: long-chain fatty acid--CoA ligase [Marinilabiliales bacterium]|nr:MAG: long-chain fatty acid--CoA ligase [Bacteroidetes bacterium GWA2_40_14]OFX62716.1 MAG: long-chain fatty acid--CoA ligase [Bacteroidetes bacterium GWC2_40_13]OFX71194.1 MAG: long-chain fatty acid--CoA ligase [Bacteroidetes bacterium GWD2_40_43]OFX92323.1 MAG: long-chain fatty acid--CoA ligase [Bacteroidetes bacterium GWE2_40_63]OFY22926.1 MAG: long-chain fatty acid--CoA ligase [Bacteroidetes bacterium GWF2_40_13]OFZ29984.1 MAG: long-chain fatty acid--CoA ligase [Bacteroidetes bacterium R